MPNSSAFSSALFDGFVSAILSGTLYHSLGGNVRKEKYEHLHHVRPGWLEV